MRHGDPSDEAVEDMANVNLHVLCFLGLVLEEVNRQIEGRNLLVKSRVAMWTRVSPIARPTQDPTDL
jgi:hypothetical protein